MRIPLRRRLHHRLDHLLEALRPPPLQGQATQLFPPGLDQVQPAGIVRQPQQQHLRPGQPRGLHPQTEFVVRDDCRRGQEIPERPALGTSDWGGLGISFCLPHRDT
jgi:hypothetical protein